MPYGVVLLPDRRTHERLTCLAAAISDGDTIHLVGHQAHTHVSVVHFEGDADQAAQVAARVARHGDGSMPVKIIGLLYAVLASGDYYVRQGGVYFGIEVIRRPDLTLLHEK